MCWWLGGERAGGGKLILLPALVTSSLNTQPLEIAHRSYTTINNGDMHKRHFPTNLHFGGVVWFSVLDMRKTWRNDGGNGRLLRSGKPKTCAK